jgi:hypothetical protein
MSSGVYSLSSRVYTIVGNGYVTAYATALGNRVKLPNTVCNHFKQPLMETERNCLGNHLWKREGTVETTTRAWHNKL